jgi:cyanate permease
MMRRLIAFLFLDDPDSTAWKMLIYFGIGISSREMVAGMTVAMMGQVLVSLNDPPVTKSNAAKRLVATMLCAFLAAMVSGWATKSGWPLVKDIPAVVLMGCAGALSMTIIKIAGKYQKNVDNSADAIADKLFEKSKDKLS